MFFPLEFLEILDLIQVINKIINIGWHPANDARQQYIEFKRDVESLREQLQALKFNISYAESQRGAELASRGQFGLIFGDFKQTLEDCGRFLAKRASYESQQGAVSNFKWFLWAKDEVDMHRDRIAVLNAKLSLALQSLEIASRNGHSVLVIELTSLVLDRLDQRFDRLDQRFDQIHAEVLRTRGETLAPATTTSYLLGSSPRVNIPSSLAGRFESAAVERYESSIPFCQGIDEAIFYLDRATHWDERRSQSEAEAQRQQLQWQRRPSRQQAAGDDDGIPSIAFRLSRLYHAYWLLQATKRGNEYKAAAQPIIANFQRQYPLLGMTAKRFVEKLEERILQAYEQLMATTPTPPQPTLDQLERAVDKDGDAWRVHCEWAPVVEEEDDDSQFGNQVAVCDLRSAHGATDRKLEIWSREPPNGFLTLVVPGPTRDRYPGVDLRKVRIRPQVTSQSGHLYSLQVFPSQGVDLKLTFQGEADLFISQQWMTGYKVVDDFPRAIVTLQIANPVIGGERRSTTGRIQLWTSTRPSPGRQLPPQLLDDPLDKKQKRRQSLIPALPPMLAPIRNFSRLTLSSSPPTTTTTTNNQNHRLNLQSSLAASRSDTPSLTGLSTVSTSSGEDGGDLALSPIQRRTSSNLIQVDNNGNVGCVLDHPDPPRMVIFLSSSSDSAPQFQPVYQPQPSRRSSVTATAGVPDIASLLVIDINQRIHINPDLCDCHLDNNINATSSSRRAAPAPRNSAVVDRNGILNLPGHSGGDFRYGSPPSLSSSSDPPSPRAPSGFGTTQNPQQQHQQQQQGRGQQHARCRRVILEVDKRRSGLSARESVSPTSSSSAGKSSSSSSPSTAATAGSFASFGGFGAGAAGGGLTMVNLAGAGRYQDGQGLRKVERLKKVTLGFESVEERVRFVRNFTDVRDLYLKRAGEANR
ncbi:hypothetical protein VTJ49DRAFT_2232 [Mycothermus thermophilus]|uniref:Uncharacterized protein n=1 Tax=Humicola insolens TaxID=85995 RepID=A0ABR3VAA7_HUMIN